MTKKMSEHNETKHDRSDFMERRAKDIKARLNQHFADGGSANDSETDALYKEAHGYTEDHESDLEAVEAWAARVYESPRAANALPECFGVSASYKDDKMTINIFSTKKTGPIASVPVEVVLAATDLLASLKFMVEFSGLSQHDKTDPAIAKVYASLAKAEPAKKIAVYLDARCRTDAWVRRDTGMTVEAMFETAEDARLWLSKHPEYVEEAR